MSAKKTRKPESSTRLTGSRGAKQCAAVILEVFAGIRGAQEAGDALPMPAQKRVGRDNGLENSQGLPAQLVRLGGEPSPLVIGEP